MIKLHLFCGFCNPKLGITADMQLGHLYDDSNDQKALVKAAICLNLAQGYMQMTGGLIHFDLWGKPLIKAKKLYKIVLDTDLAQDMAKLSKTTDYMNQATRKG